MSVLKYLCAEMLQLCAHNYWLWVFSGIALSILFHVVQRAHSARPLWSKRPYYGINNVLWFLYSLSLRLCLRVGAHPHVFSACPVLHPADENNFDTCKHISKGMIQDNLALLDIFLSSPPLNNTCFFISYQYDLKPHGHTLWIVNWQQQRNASVSCRIWQSFLVLFYFFHDVIHNAFCANHVLQQSCLANYRAEILFFSRLWYMIHIQFVLTLLAVWTVVLDSSCDFKSSSLLCQLWAERHDRWTER